MRAILSYAFAVAAVLTFSRAADGVELEHAENIAAGRKSNNANVKTDENDKAFWRDIGNDLLRRKLNTERQYGLAKNVIFFLGDGMSIATMTAARIYMGQLANKTGESEMLSFEKFPFTGLSKTYCVDSQVADSACSATAFMTGVKGNFRTIGVPGNVMSRDCMATNDLENQLASSVKWAQQAGKRTGVVSTMRVTHATPAGAYANVAHRDWECDGDVAKDPLADPECRTKSLDIARQLIERDTGRNLNLIMGGGRTKMLPNTTSDEQNNVGERLDKRNLIDEWLDIDRSGARKAYVGNRSQLKSLNFNETDYLLGLFAASHMSFNLLADKSLEPTLAEMTETAIKVLSKGNNGYFLFVEGGLIDWAHHGNAAHLSLDETVMLSESVRRAVALTSRRDTLIVVTADHSHTMTISGYARRGSDILGHPLTAADGMPYSTLSYANGPSAKNNDTTTGRRRDMTDDNPRDPLYQQPAMVNLTYETHGGDDVAVFALGPWAHLFVGTYEQNYVPYAISYAGNFGPGAEMHAGRTPPTRALAADTTSAATRHPTVTGLLLFASCYAFGALRFR